MSARDNGEREAAQQLFETCVDWYPGDAAQKLIWIIAMLQRWPWLRPNPWTRQ